MTIDNPVPGFNPLNFGDDYKTKDSMSKDAIDKYHEEIEPEIESKIESEVEEIEGDIREELKDYVDQRVEEKASTLAKAKIDIYFTSIVFAFGAFMLAYSAVLQDIGVTIASAGLVTGAAIHFLTR